jgi:hypothetical protein
LEIKANFDKERIDKENKIVADADGKLHPEKSYSLSEVIAMETERLSKLPARCPNESKRELLNALQTIRHSFPFMLSQPGVKDDDQKLKEEEIVKGLNFAGMQLDDDEEDLLEMD